MSKYAYIADELPDGANNLQVAFMDAAQDGDVHKMMALAKDQEFIPDFMFLEAIDSSFVDDHRSHYAKQVIDWRFPSLSVH